MYSGTSIPAPSFTQLHVKPIPLLPHHQQSTQQPASHITHTREYECSPLQNSPINSSGCMSPLPRVYDFEPVLLVGPCQGTKRLRNNLESVNFCLVNRIAKQDIDKDIFPVILPYYGRKSISRIRKRC